MLQRIMVFINNMRAHSGLWREHSQLINNLTKTIHLFYMPEVHSYLVPMLFEFIVKGNNYVKELSCHCLAKILKYQHDSSFRDELLKSIEFELISSSNWKQRRTFVLFCKYAVRFMSKEFFEKHFMREYINCSKDKVPSVRMEFVNSLLLVKPYFDNDQNISLELVDILTSMNSDPDRDVVEAVEHTDF